METALISGASRGIGRAIAERLAHSGYRVFLLGRDADALREVNAACGAAGFCAGDLADAGFVEQAVDAAVHALGAVDVLVNNAGSARREPVYAADLDAWRTVMALNFDAAVALSRLLLPSMIERGRGAVVNISSISGRNTDAGGAIYAASKHALNGFSGCLFEDVRDYGIKVSTIMPGFVETALTAGLDKNAAHMIRPEDIADAVSYVLSASPACCPTEIVIRPQRRP